MSIYIVVFLVNEYEGKFKKIKFGVNVILCVKICCGIFMLYLIFLCKLFKSWFNRK